MTDLYHDIREALATAERDDLLTALTLLYDNIAEYQRINNLGGYDNHDMRMARAAITRATGRVFQP